MNALTGDPLDLRDMTGGMSVDEVRRHLNMLAEQHPDLLESTGRALLLGWADFNRVVR